MLHLNHVDSVNVTLTVVISCYLSRMKPREDKKSSGMQGFFKSIVLFNFLL